jgi:hypothetical protein
MIVTLVIFICVSVLECFFIVFLIKQHFTDKKVISTQAGNISVLKKYYDEHTVDIVNHIKTEEEAGKADNEDAKKHIADIIAHNNELAGGMHNNKADK